MSTGEPIGEPVVLHRGGGRRWLRALAVLMGVLALAVVALVWYTHTEAFHAWAHRRIVTALEHATGGRVELRQLTWNASKLEVDARGVVIHGLEASGEAPYISVDHVAIRAKVLSWFGRQLALRSVVVDNPRIHLIIYPDGHTNQPEPKSGTTGAPEQPLFDVKLEHAQVRNGVLLLNDRPIRFDLNADGVQAELRYLSAISKYEGTASVERIRGQYGELKPFDLAASTHFAVLTNRVDVQKLQVTAGKSQLEASGSVLDFVHPHAEFTYTAQLEVAHAGNILRMPELRRGMVSLNGRASYTGENYTSTGKATLKDGEYRSGSLTLAGINGGAEYTIDNRTFSMPHFFAHLLGGTAVGNVVVENWTNPDRSGLNAAQQGQVHAQFDNAPAGKLAAAFATRTLPLDQLHAAGSASGTIDVSWRGLPATAIMRFAMSVQPAMNPAPGELPLTAQMRGTYSEARGLSLSQFEASGRSLQATASGTLGRGLHVQISAAGTLQDVAQILQAWSGQEKLPPGLAGQASFQGTVSGTAKAPVIAGRLSLADLDVPLPLKLPAPAAAVMKPVTEIAPPPSAPKTRMAHYDSAAADIVYSPAQLQIANGTVRRGAEQVTMSATIALVNGSFYNTNPLQAKLSARNFRLEDLTALAGYSPPISGVVNGEADIHGTQDDPRGMAFFQLKNATVYGEPMASAGAKVTFVDQKAEFSNIVISQDSARITGDADYNLKTTAFRFNLNGNKFHLAEFTGLQGKRVHTSGILSFVARGSGTWQAPVVDADLTLRDVSINGERLGDLTGTAQTTGGVMRVRAHSDAKLADLEVDGTVYMRDDFAADLNLKIARLDAGPLLQMLLAGKFTGQSSLSGNVRLTGPLRDPRSLTVAGDLSSFKAAVENVGIENDGPLQFVVRNQVLRLLQFKLAGTDTVLNARGTVALTGNRELDLHADGRVSLALLQSFNNDLHSAGAMEFNMRAGGTVAQPTLFGSVQIHNGTISNVNFPTALSNLNGTLIFNQDRCQIRQLTGSAGGGEVTFGGFVSYGNGLAFDVNAQAREVRVRYPQGLSESIDGTLRLTGTRDISTLAGNITVVRFAVTPQFDVAVAIAASQQPPPPPDPTSWLNNLRLNIRVNSAPDLQLNTSLARLSGDMNLTIRGTAIRPAVLGRINITEGQVSFNGATYQIDRGDISFSNPVKIEPVVDVAATTRVRDYDVTLGFHGPVERMSTTYRSEPPLPTADIISLLAFGDTREESDMASATQPTFSEQASNAILGQALNAAVSNRVQRLFGVSRVKIAPDIGGAESNPNARVTIEQQVSKDFTVTYITDLTRSNQQSIQVEYNYNRDVSIIGSRDQYGIVSFDVRLRRRKR